MMETTWFWVFLNLNKNGGWNRLLWAKESLRVIPIAVVKLVVSRFKQPEKKIGPWKILEVSHRECVAAYENTFRLPVGWDDPWWNLTFSLSPRTLWFRAPGILVSIHHPNPCPYLWCPRIWNSALCSIGVRVLSLPVTSTLFRNSQKRSHPK